jgi:uncharacterized protein YdcH (DUF465 family)
VWFAIGACGNRLPKVREGRSVGFTVDRTGAASDSMTSPDHPEQVPVWPGRTAARSPDRRREAPVTNRHLIDASRPARGVFFVPPPSEGDSTMFEGRQQEVEQMMQADAEFRSLYLKHRDLEKQVTDAELGTRPLDDLTLGRLKKEKLAAKDRLTRMYEQHAHH